MTDNIYYKEVNLRELIKIIKFSKKLILSITFFSALLSIIISWNLPNIYHSSALLAPTEDEEAGISNLLNQFSGFAGMAGLSIAAENEIFKSQIAMEVLKSRLFTEKFIKKYNILPQLFAVDNWDASSRELVIDKKIYNIQTKEWLRPAKSNRGNIPSSQEAYEEFKKIMSVYQDKINGFITVTIKHESPDIAKQWVDWLIQDLNESMRQKDIDESREQIKYLKQQVALNQTAAINQVFFSLIQQQLQTAMLAETKREYVLTTIDPAISPEMKSTPYRSLFVLLGTLIGCMFGIIISFYTFMNQKK